MNSSQKIVTFLICTLIILLIITALTPVVKGQTNILPNPDFEDNLNNWSTFLGTASYTVDSSTKHSGSSSVMGVETYPDNIGRLYQNVTDITIPGQQYQISGWIKTSGVTGSVVIALDYVTSYYTPSDGHVSEIGQVTGTTDWTYYESPVFTLPEKPADADALFFLLDFNAGTGTAWWDDLQLIAVSGVVPTQKPSGTSDSWIYFGHDLSGARYSSSTAPKTSQILWQTQLDGAVRTSVTISGSTAYVGCFGGSVYALDGSTGNTVWTYKTGDNVWSTPAEANGIVYVGSNDWSIYALNAQNGGLLWSFPTGGGVFSSPIVVGNVVYVGSTDSNMYALDAAKGVKIWNFTTAGQIRDTAAVVDGVVYVGCQVMAGTQDAGNGVLYALNANTGALIWSSPTNDSDTYTNSSPAVVDGVVYVGSTDHNLYAFRASDGSTLWTFPTPDKVSSSPAVHDGVVYVGSESGDFYAVNAKSGTQVWTYSTSGAIYSSPAIADGAVYVGSYNPDNSVYAFDASSGSLLWSYQTGSGVFSSPTVTGDVMFVGSYDSTVYAFGTEFTPGANSNQNPASYDSGTVWAPTPVNGVAASVVTVSAVAATSIVAAAVTSVPAATGSSFLGKLVGKLRDLLPFTVKDWLESIVLSKHKVKLDDKQGSPYRPTKSEIVVYIASILVFTFSFAYVQVNSLPEFVLVLPTFIVTSLVVGLIRTYLLTVYARRRGVWTEYKLWYLGIVLFLVSTLAFRAPFSSPTRRVSASNKPSNFVGVVMSISILLNLVFASVFFALVMAGFTMVGGAGLAMCLVAAFIDTIPVKPMFGADVFQYNKRVWAILFVVSLTLYVVWIAHVF
ncbi:MAG: PQQ-binding-like beta-propeller repeat protein [Candidatus Bathyarchaeia archaeon]